MRRVDWLSIILVAVLSVAVSITVYAATFLAFPVLFPKSALSLREVLFLEGMILVIGGILLFVGYGGLSLYTYRAAVLSSAAGAVSGKDTPSPREIMRQDAWKPKGHLRTALILFFAGTILIAAYFVTA